MNNEDTQIEISRYKEMKTDDATSILDTLKVVNEKLEDLNLRFNRVERAKDEVLQDLKNLKQSIDLMKGLIRGK